jgi:hypothetical protein
VTMIVKGKERGGNGDAQVEYKSFG